MTIIRTVPVLIALILACAGRPLAAASFDAYLLAGQSNMDGRGKAADLDEAQRRPDERALIFYRNPPASSDGWKPLAPGFSIPPGYKGGVPSAVFGPELGFAAALLAAKPGTRLALIKGSKGGTTIEQWSPGTKGASATQGPCYRDFLATIAMATEALAKQGDTLTVRALLWHQGESNAKDDAATYQAKLANLIARLREDLGQPDLPVVVGEVFDDHKRDGVRAAQRQIATAVPHVAFASAEGLTTSDNGTHFDARSQLVLGRRFAEALATIIGK
jgi:iduronate 2-sulfatase